jgi:hypothetical protein
MIEIFLLIGAVSGIASFARGRGGSPWLWGTVAVLGYVFTLLVGSALTRSQYPFAIAVVAWGWIGGVALYTRFMLARGRGGPSGSWTCPECKVLNRSYAVLCEACGEPYVEP